MITKGAKTQKNQPDRAKNGKRKKRFGSGRLTQKPLGSKERKTSANMMKFC
jgi:hypothetical protein